MTNTATGAATVAKPDAPIVFSTHALCKVYCSGEIEVHALRDVEMEKRRGEFVVLFGASGSGEVRFGDTALTGASEKDLTTYRREHVGFVFHFYNLIPSLTVRESLALVTHIAKNLMPVDEAIERVGPTPRRDHFRSCIATGQQVIAYPPAPVRDGVRVTARKP